MATRAGLRIAAIFAGVSLASFAAWALTPRIEPFANTEPLATLVPDRFGDWRAVELAAAPIDPRVQNPGDTDRESPYDDVLLRGYQNSHGDVVVLALAYGRHQRQEVKIHRPELCYTSQGFEVVSHKPVDMALADGAAPAHGARMLVRGSDRVETVSYWIRIGDEYSRSAWRTRTHIFSEGVHGRVVDGMLVRVSQMLPGGDSATPERFALQESFLAELVNALPAGSRRLLIGQAT